MVCGGQAWHALFLALGSKGCSTDMLVAAAASSMQALVGRLIVLTLLVLKVWNSSPSALILLFSGPVSFLCQHAPLSCGGGDSRLLGANAFPFP